MPLSDLLPALKALPAPEKLQALAFLQEELTAEQGEFPFPPGARLPVWSPFDAYEAAAVMSKLIEERRNKS